MTTPDPYLPTPAASTSPRTGRVALIAASIVVVVNLVQQVFVQFVPLLLNTLDLGSGSVGVLLAPFTVVILVLSIVALVFGLLGRSTPGQQVAAGVGIGIGAAHIAGIVVSLVAPLVVGALY